MKKTALIMVLGAVFTACLVNNTKKAGTPYVSDNSDTLWIAYEDINGGRAILTSQYGSTDTFAQAVSASGSRYVKDSFELWEHHGELTLRVNDTFVLFTGKKVEP